MSLGKEEEAWVNCMPRTPLKGQFRFPEVRTSELRVFKGVDLECFY
jgi:hypothetical protein